MGEQANARAAFDAWREVYNTKRPHEAIGLDVPADRYRSSKRAMPDLIAPPDYEPAAQVRKADGSAASASTDDPFAVPRPSRSLASRTTDTDGIFELCYRRHVLAQLDLRQNIVQSVNHVPEHSSTLSPV